MHPSAEHVTALYERHAQAFDRARGRQLIERGWLDRLCAMVPAGGDVLDLGCGMGEPIAAYLIGCGYRLTGLDSAPSLVEIARSRFPDHTWKVGDMRRLDLRRRFGGILAWDSFFHLTAADQREMFAVFRSHAVPGAALLFTSGPSHGEAIGPFEGEALHHASLAPEEYVRLLAAHGFGVVDHVREDADCGGHTVWLSKLQS